MHKVVCPSAMPAENKVDLLNSIDQVSTSKNESKLRKFNDIFMKQRIEGKGWGLLASRSFKCGEKIFYEQALESPLRLVHGQLTVRTHGEGLLRLAEQLKMYDLKQAERLSLSISLPYSDKELELQSRDPELASYIGQIRSNSFIKTTSQGTKILALFPTLSLLNHACQPNTAMLDGSLYALQDIACGEELEICYNSQWQLQPKHVRQAAMESSYGFVCRCLRCLAERCPIEEMLSDSGSLQDLTWVEAAIKKTESTAPSADGSLRRELVRVLSSLPETHWQVIEAREWLIKSYLKTRHLEEATSLIEQQLKVFGESHKSGRLLATLDPHPLSLVRTLRQLTGSLESLPQDVRMVMHAIDEHYQ